MGGAGGEERAGTEISMEKNKTVQIKIKRIHGIDPFEKIGL